MGRTESRFWEDTHSPDFARRERRVCKYETYFPDKLDVRTILIEGDVAADISDAELAVQRFASLSGGLSDTEGIARLLLRMRFRSIWAVPQT